nr:LacI family DNA-binding transcriptional regulator [Micrococcus sp. KRD070]
MVGIKDVARMAGVSTATASRALTGSGPVAAATRTRVQEAVATLGYVADSAASSLASGRTRNIGLVTPSVHRWFFAAVLEGAADELVRHGYDLTLYDVGQDPERRSTVISDLLPRRRLDALITLSFRLSVFEFAGLERLGLPVIAVGGRLPAGETLPDWFTAVQVDDARAARMATEHLLELGHRDIAYVGRVDEDIEFQVSTERTRGFLHALAAIGVRTPADWMVPADFTIGGTYHQARALLADPRRRPTAVMCISDEMAMGTWMAAHSLGLRVPEDVSVMGLDGHPEAARLGISTVDQNPLEQGRPGLVRAHRSGAGRRRASGAAARPGPRSVPRARAAARCGALPGPGGAAERGGGRRSRIRDGPARAGPAGRGRPRRGGAPAAHGAAGLRAHAATPGTTHGSETARARAPTGGGATPGRPRGRRAGHRAGRRRRHRRAVVAGVPGRRDGGGAGAGGRGAGRHLGGRGAPGGRDAGERDAGEGAGRGCPRGGRRRGGRRRRGRGAGRGRPRPDCRAHRPGACATGRLRRARGTGVGERPGSAAPADGRGVRLLRPRGDGGAGRTRPAGRGRRAACRRRAPDVGPHRAGPRGTRGGASGGDGRGGRAGPAQRPRRGPRGAGRRRGGSDVAGRDRRSALTPGPDPAPEAGGPDGGTPRAPGRSSPGPAAWCGVSRLG